MYSSLFNKYLNPFYESFIKGRKVYSRVHELNRSQFNTVGINTSNQLMVLKELLMHARINCDYYREILEELNIPDSNFTISDFHKIPFLTKDIINENKHKLIANNYAGKLWDKSTGGSTGIPLHFHYTKESNDWRVACSMRGYGWAGCFPGVKQAYIWGSNLGQMSWLRHMKERLHHKVLRQLYFNCFKFTENEKYNVYKRLNLFRPEIIVGYTNPLYDFAVFLKTNNYELQFKPRSIISAAEALHPFQRQTIEEVFGCNVFNTYGSREFMLIASECEHHKGLHVNIENLYVEIIRDDGTIAGDGEKGHIVITDLHNYGMPFIRYKIGDLGIMSGRQCECGRGLPILEKVEGRSLDIIKTPDDRSVPGEFFPHLMKDVNCVKQFQVVQKKIDVLNIYMVLHGEMPVSDREFISNEIEKVMGRKIKIIYNFVSEIALTQTGKFRVTISEI